MSRFEPVPAAEIFGAFAATLTGPQRDAFAKVMDRYDDEQRRLADWINGYHGVEHVFDGALLAGSLSPPFEFRSGALLQEVRVLLGTAGSSSTVITLYKNAVSIGTVTLASSDTAETAYLGVAFGPTDILTIEVTTAGTGAAKATVICEAA